MGYIFAIERLWTISGISGTPSPLLIEAGAFRRADWARLRSTATDILPTWRQGTSDPHRHRECSQLIKTQAFQTKMRTTSAAATAPRH